MKSSQNTQNLKKRARRIVAALFFFSILSTTGCSLMKDRPVQLMSDTASALKAAKEVNAESLAPDLYRRATDAYLRAQNEYRMKNFSVAETYANRAKELAETAEFEALQKGSSRTSLLPPEEPVAPPPPSELSPPAGQLATEAMRREAQGGTQAQPQVQGQPSTPSGGTSSGGGAATPSYPGTPSAPTGGSYFTP